MEGERRASKFASDVHESGMIASLVSFGRNLGRPSRGSLARGIWRCASSSRRGRYVAGGQTLRGLRW